MLAPIALAPRENPPMGIFVTAGVGTYLPGVEVAPRERTLGKGAWLFDQYVTVRLYAPVEGMRVHTNGRSFPQRPGSAPQGRWVAIGDVIQTAAEIANSRSLPGWFTHAARALVPAQTVVNVGICAPLFNATGGGAQLEYVSGPPIRFMPLKDVGGHDNKWHGKAGNA